MTKKRPDGRVRINIHISYEAYQLLQAMAESPKMIGNKVSELITGEAARFNLGGEKKPLVEIADSLRTASRQLDRRLGIKP